jgi:ubiquinone/menaquinone biosynthesis C-methylase UbiE
LSEKPIRAHIGSALIYCRDYINVDVIGSGAALAKDNPAAVKMWITDAERYYSRMQHITQEAVERGYTQDHGQMVCDRYGDWSKLPFEDNSLDEILSRQVFEHLSMTEAKAALMEARRCLKMGGILRLSVPDMPATLEMYRQTEGGDFFKRHLIGTKKNQFSWHVMGYPREGLIALLEEFGFAHVEDEPSPHFYPSICVKHVKVPHETLDRPSEKPWIAAWQYCGDPLGTPLEPVEGSVLEIGPGSAPLPWSTCVVDNVQENLDRIEGKETHLADVENLPLWKAQFDYCYTAHCLEHTNNPVKAAAEISRVAKRGIVICPSIGKDFLFIHHDPSHTHWVLPSTGDGVMRFMRVNESMRDAMRDDTTSGWIHRLLRLTDHRFGSDAQHMRKWFNAAEPHLDVIHHWEGTLKIEVIG